MFRLLKYLGMGISLLFFTSSCSSSGITASGAKHKSFSKFSFKINNNQVTAASVYKRYVTHNKRNEARVRPALAHKRSKTNVVPKKSSLALGK